MTKPLEDEDGRLTGWGIIRAYTRLVPNPRQWESLLRGHGMTMDAVNDAAALVCGTAPIDVPFEGAFIFGYMTGLGLGYEQGRTGHLVPGYSRLHESDRWKPSPENGGHCDCTAPKFGGVHVPGCPKA